MRRALDILGRDPLWALAVVGFMAAVAVYVVLSAGTSEPPHGAIGPTGPSAPAIVAPPSTPLPGRVARSRAGATRSRDSTRGEQPVTPAPTRQRRRTRSAPTHHAPRPKRRVAPAPSSPSQPPSSPPPEPSRPPLTVTVPAPVTVCTPAAAVNCP